MIRRDYVIPCTTFPETELEITGGWVKAEKGSKAGNETWDSTESVRGSGLMGLKAKAPEAVQYQMGHLIKIRGQQEACSRQGSGQQTRGISNRGLEVTVREHWRLYSSSVRVGMDPRGMRPPSAGPSGFVVMVHHIREPTGAMGGDRSCSLLMLPHVS